MKTHLGMSSDRIKQSFLLTILMGLLIPLIACNSKSSEDDSDIVVTPSIVAIRNFYLRANDNVFKNLDSVFFSIDLKNGVIFNADSLPKGTKVNKLVPNITFANTMTKAELTYLNSDNELKTVDYLTNPDDSINFNGPVTLNVTAANGVSSFVYNIKVNVHQENPDTLIWSKLASSSLPSRFQSPLEQKTLIKENTVYTLLKESNNQYTLSTCTELNDGIWNKQELSLSFVPNIQSFVNTSDLFWILDQEGNIYFSENGIDWTNTGEEWVNIIGTYGNSLLGVKSVGSSLVYAFYPETEESQMTPIDENFPIFNSSSAVQIENSWSPLPVTFLMGGVDIDGNLTNAVWAYDGNTWAAINTKSLPALESPMLARYVVYRSTPSAFTQRAFDVWILFGGLTENGSMNREVYFSYDNGVNWNSAPESMQLPEIIPSLRGADLIVASYDLSADISDIWQPADTKSQVPTRASYTIDGFDITWQCPYLYIFGGYDSQGVLSDVLWRGVLARLRFTPLI